MEKLKIEVAGYQTKYLSQIEEIHGQNAFSKGGMFHDECIVPEIEKIAKEINSKVFYVLLLKGDKVLGVAQVLDRYVPDSLYISMLAVDKNYQRMGVASTMLEYIVEHSKNFKGVMLECFDKNEIAKALYEKLKFIMIGTSKVNDIQLGEINVVYYCRPTFLDKNKQILDYTYHEKQEGKTEVKVDTKHESENHLE